LFSLLEILTFSPLSLSHHINNQKTYIRSIKYK
jgi:hypothetical protein